jgi:hypothetical protein
MNSEASELNEIDKLIYLNDTYRHEHINLSFSCCL